MKTRETLIRELRDLAAVLANAEQTLSPAEQQVIGSDMLDVIDALEEETKV